MNEKKQLRAAFRQAVFARDGLTCRLCGKRYTRLQAVIRLDAHHITPREAMPNGGYVVENGISLCKIGVGDAFSCHYRVECGDVGADELYRLIDSSYEQAVEASQKSGRK